MSTLHLFTSKADTLKLLLQHEDLHIPPVYSFTVAAWRDARQAVLADIRAAFPHASLAVRSSCRREDKETSSGAGAFTSLLHVPSEERLLAKAIEMVIASYGFTDAEDQVLIQPMIEGITVSGVITTRVLADGSPYYVINYDDESGRTDTITGGTNVSKAVYIFRDAVEDDFDSDRLRSFVALAARVEQLCGSDALDIEFCLDAAGTLHVLQVRPLCTQAHWIADADAHIRRNIDFVKHFIGSRMRPWPELYGQRTILGVMPDWNPAEMIGVTPRRLSSSLYRELITCRVWSQARELMGYRSMPPDELMLLIGGRPYIDVRASFNSFLPAGLDPVTCEALISAWLDRLDRNPHLHDKVEFDVAQTVLDFCFDQHLDERYPDLLTRARREDFRSTLRRLTLQCLSRAPRSSFAWAAEANTELRNRQAARPQLLRAQRPHPYDVLLPRIQLLLEECRMYGTLPFSILARHAFIAETLLRTAVKRGALSPSRLASFKLSIRTVAGEMSQDFRAVCSGGMDRSAFMQRYGHLRPSSYDLLSPRYMDREGLFVESDAPAPSDTPDFAFTQEEQHNLSRLLAEVGMEQVLPAQLEAYARQSIAGRESAKFIFTRNLSDIMEYLAYWGEGAGLSREDVSFLDIRDCLEWSTQTLLRPAQEYFRECVEKGRAHYDLGRSLKLGYLIRSTRDVYVAPQHRSAPNFVGRETVEAPVFRLCPDTPCSVDIGGRIICIENADPGFDWIFTRRIAGLVTMFGGANSHMAIRCAEYNLPAAIGVGENLFKRIAGAAKCRLNAGDCSLQEL